MSTRKELRDALIGGKKAQVPSKIIEIDGNKYKVTGMTLKEFRASIEDEREYSGIHEVIDHLFDPTTGDKVFNHTDVEIIKDLPANSVGFITEVQRAVMELTTGVKVEFDEDGNLLGNDGEVVATAEEVQKGLTEEQQEALGK